jgi:hypothetical protein
MSSHFSSIWTSLLLPISLIALIGNNNPAVAVSSPQELANIQLSSKPSGEIKSVEPAEKIQFFCGSSYNDRLKKNVPTMIAQKGLQKRTIAQWVNSMDEYWTPERRCQQVSRGMQLANTAGNLKYITNGKMSDRRVICTTTEVNGDCKNVLMTVRPKDKPLKLLIEFNEIFNFHSDIVDQHTCGDPQIYLRIDLDRLWRNAGKV